MMWSQRIRKSVAVKWSLWKHAGWTAAGVAVTVVAYGCGWATSTVDDAGPLVHAGALATVVSVALTLYDYGSALADGQKAAERVLERMVQGLPLTGAEALAGFRARATANTRRAVRGIRTFQAWMLIVATVVWGFGDIAPKWLPALFREAAAPTSSM